MSIANKEIDCAFCDPLSLEERTIRNVRHFLSIVSSPRFRPDHCLVVPERHVSMLFELEPEESAAIMSELGRLSMKLDQGYGTGVMQKYQPTQAENGIKMNHLHFHVFPRQEDESNLFPVPEPNSFEGFTQRPTDAEIAALVHELR
jgi:diadenosine tetraphosphate (Ap4A) HIT family hydrolase